MDETLSNSGGESAQPDVESEGPPAIGARKVGSDAVSGDSTPGMPELAFLQLRPLSIARIGRAFDAVGYSLEDSPTPTVRTPHFDMHGNVIGAESPTLYLRFAWRRIHPVQTYGLLLSIGNEINMRMIAIKAHVQVEALPQLASGEPGAQPSASTSATDPAGVNATTAYCVLIAECEVPCGTGLADVQLYDVIVKAVGAVEAATSRYPILSLDAGDPPVSES